MVKAVAAGVTSLMALLAPGPAFAFGTQSVETDLVLADCTIDHTNDFETVWACPGYKGVPVMVRRAQVKATLSFGLTSTAERAARQLLPEGYAPTGKVEWRLSNREGNWKPFATIVRYAADGPGAGQGAAEVLVVTRLGTGTTCQIAFADATADADALALAQQAADAHGFDFDCSKDQPQRLGRFAAW